MNDLHAILGYPLLAIAALELTLGFVLLRQNERRSISINAVASFAFFCSAFSLSVGLMYLHAYLGHDYNIYARLSWIGWFSTPAALQFLYFLEDERSRTGRTIGHLLYPFWTLVLALTLLTDLVVTDQYELIPFSNRPGALEKPLRLIGAGLVLWVVVKTFLLRRTMTGVVRKALDHFFYGVIIFGSGGIVTAGVLQLFGGFGFEPGLSSYFSFPWVVLTFYAIARYQLFDVRLILSRVITAVLLLVLFALVQAGAYMLFEQALGFILSFLGSLILVGFLFFGTSLSRQVASAVESLVLRDPFEHRSTLREATRAMSTMMDLNGILRYIQRFTRERLGTSRAELHLAGPAGGFVLHPLPEDAAPGGDAQVMPAEIIDHIRLHQQPVSLRVEELILSSTGRVRLVEELRRRAVEILIPFFFAGRLQGALTFGPKTGGRSYSHTDLMLLEDLAGHAAAAIENSVLFEETLQVKQSLQESESMFRALAESAPAAILIIQEGRIQYANPSGLRLTGLLPEDAPGAEFLPLVATEHRELVRSPSPAAGQEPVQGGPLEIRIETRSGEVRWALFSQASADYRGHPSLVMTLLDVTESKELQGRLQYLQKMEAMGKLAGGVAHDFNNVLGAIVGHGSMLQLALRRDDPLQKHADAILSATERAASITQRLLSFGRRKEAALKPCDLSALVLQHRKFLNGTLPPSVRLIVATAEEAVPAMADPGQIERVLMNLVVNARDAMPEGGEITIRTGRTAIDTDFINRQGFGRAGDYGLLSVQDTGSGMSEEVRRRIFEPFFTTKAAGKGTGFGLSIVYDILKDHRGYITVESEPGRGAVFTVLLPLETAAASAAAQPRPAPRQAQDRTVLLVDDDEMARSFARAVLEEQGLRVVEAQDGAQALELLRKHAQDVHLVLTDILMPRMNGHELYLACRKARPDLPFLFTSGYSEDILVGSGILEKGQPFCPKPASRSSLAAKTREVLGI